ncbi:hypothetical protein HDU91_006188 [Kappamyces sp. JEL0680]|nr:hypothetical protein HDU91_006188 [Kappamyces sp. JEL0680]
MTSCVWRGMSVDLIHFPQEQPACYWYDYGDLSMCQGVMIKKLGMKWSDDGLYLRGPGSQSIHLTRDWKQAFAFFGWDADVFLKGFAVERDLAEFIASSIYFDPAYYSSEQSLLNREDRRREESRKLYPILRSLLAGWDMSERTIRKPQLDDILSYFGQTHHYQSLVAREEKQKLVKSLFNGSLVQTWTGLSQKPLGVFMDAIRDIPDWQDRVVELGTQPELLQAWVLDEFQHWRRQEQSEMTQLVEQARDLSLAKPDRSTHT